MSQLQTTADLLKPAAKANTSVGFFDLESFELTQRMAASFASSSIVPLQFQKRNKSGKASDTENMEAISNCCIAINMAARLNADPLMVMQNLYIVHGKPSWSSQWIIATINQCGRFSTLKYRMVDKGETTIKGVQNLACVAYAVSLDTGETVESPEVSIQMAIAESWYGKNGSKWKTMPELMLRYRAASFFGKLYAPELLMGFQSTEEAEEMAYIETMPTGEVVEETTKVTKGKMKKAEAVAAETPPQEALPTPNTEAEVIAQQVAATSIQDASQEAAAEYVDTQTGEVLYNTGPLSEPNQYPVNPDEDDFFAGTDV